MRIDTKNQVHVIRMNTCIKYLHGYKVSYDACVYFFMYNVYCVLK